MWTCTRCGRRFANKDQWHSCIDLSLESVLADASNHARRLYRAVEEAIATCGEFRIHPQRSRVAFITRMTFAGVKLARRWVDVSFIIPVPIDDHRIRGIDCYGPTSFAHTVRLEDVIQLDSEIGDWLCRAWRRGNQETLDPNAHVEPLTGRALELVVVPLRALVIDNNDDDSGDLALQVPRYAAEVFTDHRAVQARLGTVAMSGTIEAADGMWLFLPRAACLRDSGLGAGDAIDVSLRADM